MGEERRGAREQGRQNESNLGRGEEDEGERERDPAGFLALIHSNNSGLLNGAGGKKAERKQCASK